MSYVENENICSKLDLLSSTRRVLSAAHHLAAGNPLRGASLGSLLVAVSVDGDLGVNLCQQ